MNEFSELVQQLKDGLITEQQLFELMTDTNGLMHLKRGKITRTGTEKKRLYFGGTVIGYGDELRAPVKFLEGSHEEALPYYDGIPYLLFHKGDMIPVGKVNEVWMDDNKEVKFTAWSQDEEYNEAIQDAMMDSQSLGFDPIEYEFNWDTFEFDVGKYRPMEISGVVFPAYPDAKTEAFGETPEEVKEAMTNVDATLSDVYVTSGTSTANEHVDFTTNSTSDNQTWTAKYSIEEKESEEMEKLKKENKILKFLTKYPNIKNREQIMELMEKYDLEEVDAEKLIMEEEKEPEEEEQAKIEENPPLPENQVPIEEKEDKSADLEARIADRAKRGFGTKK